MKLVTFTEKDGKLQLGALINDDRDVLNLQTAFKQENGKISPHFHSMISIIEGGKKALELAENLIVQSSREAIYKFDDITLKTPIPQPPQIRDCLCFEEHLIKAFDVLRRVKAEAQDDPDAALTEFESKGLFRIPEVWYERPLYYKSNRLSVIGTNEEINWPYYAELLDYELEFGFFVGKKGCNIPKEKAKDHIFGYSIFNDVSARDTQTIEMPGGLGPSKSKDFDTGNVIGPCIVTADEIDPYNLSMIVRVNGEERSRGSSSTIHWRFEDLIEHISQSETLYPGEFIASGTVGNGSGLELERYLSPGDIIELEVEGIGILRNKIVRNQT